MSTPPDDDPHREPPPWQQQPEQQGGWQSSWPPPQQEQQQQGGWQSSWEQPQQNQWQQQGDPNQWQQQQTPQWSGYQPSPPTPGNAIASLILGIVSIVLCPIITAVVGLVLGYNAKREIDNSGGRLGGRGVAVGGIVTSWIGLVLWGLPILGVIVFSV